MPLLHQIYKFHQMTCVHMVACVTYQLSAMGFLNKDFILYKKKLALALKHINQENT